MPSMRIVTLALSAYVLLFTIACKRSRPVSDTLGSKEQTSYTQIDPATAGSVEGKVRYPATPPPGVAIDMSADPGCGKGPNVPEQYVVTDGNLANVFVYVKSGLGNRAYAPPTTPVVLDQKGCRYIPHVIGVMAGQPVEIRNSDPTMHDINVQPLLPANHPFDFSEAPNAPAVHRSFEQAETMIPVRCNAHPWMEAFINVAANPFFAISDSHGHYTISGLPPGTYTLVAVHEKLGEKQQLIHIVPHQPAEADFTF